MLHLVDDQLDSYQQEKDRYGQDDVVHALVSGVCLTTNYTNFHELSQVFWQTFTGKRGLLRVNSINSWLKRFSRS